MGYNGSDDSEGKETCEKVSSDSSEGSEVKEGTDKRPDCSFNENLTDYHEMIRKSQVDKPADFRPIEIFSF